MSDTKIKTSNIGNLAVTHALLHTDMDLTSKTVQVATPTSNTHPATKLYVDTEVANLIDSAPGTLDTLNELAAAVNDDANFNATIASSIATKLPLAGGTMTGNLQIYKAEPIITLQRSNNALLSGLSWQGSGGAEAASIKLDGTSGATNTLIMSTYNGSTMAERLRLMTNAAGGIAVTGTISVTGTVDGVDIAARDAILTSTTTTAEAALPKAGGTMTGDLTAPNITATGDMFITSTSPKLKLTDTDTADEYTELQNSNGNTIIDTRNGTENGQFIIRGLGGGTADEFGRFDELGRFGVGSSNPDHLLHVGNVLNSLGTTAGDSLSNLRIQSDTTNNDSLLFTAQRLADGADWTTAAQRIQRRVDSTRMGYMEFGHNVQALITFGKGSTERVRIDGDGNVGIGTSSPGDANEGAGLRVHKYVDRAQYYSPAGSYAGSFGYTNNTNTKTWLSVDSSYNQTSSVSAGLFLSPFHSDANGSFAGHTIKSIRDGGALLFSRVNTATSTGTAATESEFMRINGSGNVGIGTDSPSRLLHLSNSSADPYLLIDGSGANRDSGIIINAGGGERKVVRGDLGGNLYFGNSNQLALYNSNDVVINESGNNADFRVECPGEPYAIFLDSSEQRLFFGNSSTSENSSESMYIDVEPGNRHMFLAGNSREVLYINRNGTDGTSLVFRKSNVQVGGVSVTSSGTTYNTTSDRRLKDNIEPISDATDKLMDMKPVTHTWIDNPDEPQVHGFIAQEMQEVIPEAVSGDAESDEMMSMDYGRITPIIVAALQDALNEIKELKARIDELENK